MGLFKDIYDGISGFIENIAPAANVLINGIDSIQSNANDKEANAIAQSNLDEQKRMNTQNQANWQTNFDYQKGLQQTIFNREDTANQRAVKDMRLAGLSPLANYSASGTGQVLNTQPFEGSAPDASALVNAKLAQSANRTIRSQNLREAIKGFKESSLIDSQIEKTQAEVDNINASTEATRASTSANVANTEANTAYLRTQNAQARLNFINSQKKFEQEYSRVQKEMNLLDEQIASAKTSNSHADRLASLQEDKMISDIGYQAQNMAKALVETAIAQHELDYYDSNSWRPNYTEFESVLTWLKDVDPQEFNKVIDNVADLLYNTFDGVKSRFSSSDDLSREIDDRITSASEQSKNNRGYISTPITTFAEFLNELIVKNAIKSNVNSNNSDSSASTGAKSSRYSLHGVSK